MLLKYIGQTPSSIQNIIGDIVPLVTGSIFDIADDRAIEILNTYPDFYIPLETTDFMPSCSSPTTLTISNFSYSVVDILTSTKRYVTGTAQANGLSLTMNCVLDIVSGEIMSNVEALAKFNRGSYLLQTSSEQYAIQSWTISGWAGTAVICWDFNVVGNSNLSIATSGASAVNSWENAVVTFTVTNNWPDIAEDTTVTITLPAGTVFVSADGSYSNVGQVYTWDLWDMISGQVIAINVTCTYNQTNGSAAMTFVVASTTVDPTPWNNSSTRNLAVYYADIQVSLSGSLTGTVLYTALNGDEISNAVTQTIGVFNNWPTQANNVSLIVTLPADVDYDNLNGGTWNAWLRTITWTRSTLANGASTSRNFSVKSAIPDTYVLDGEVTATSPDGDPLDNTTTKNLTFANWVANISIWKIDNSWTTAAPIDIIFTLPAAVSVVPDPIFNSGGAYYELLWDVVVTLPVDVDYVSSSYTKQWLDWASSTVSWVYNAWDRTITFTDCLINDLGTQQIDITVNCLTPDTYTITWVLTPWQSFITDTNLANNTANLSLTVTTPFITFPMRVKYNIIPWLWETPTSWTSFSWSISGNLNAYITTNIEPKPWAWDEWQVWFYNWPELVDWEVITVEWGSGAWFIYQTLWTNLYAIWVTPQLVDVQRV